MSERAVSATYGSVANENRRARAGWTQEREDLLATMWKRGDPVAKISAALEPHLGRRLTKNAIISKVTRIGANADPEVQELRDQIWRREASIRTRLQIADSRKAASARRKGAGKKPAKAPGVRKPAPNFNVIKTPAQTAAITPGAQPASLKGLHPIDQGRPVVPTLESLSRTQCKWPIGDPRKPGFGFCGCAKVDNPEVPYCEAHLDVALSGQTANDSKAMRGLRRHVAA